MATSVHEEILQAEVYDLEYQRQLWLKRQQDDSEHGSPSSKRIARLVLQFVAKLN